MFVDRPEIMQALEEMKGSPDGALVILYGRARMGKTEVAQQFAKGRPLFYFTADYGSEKDHLTQIRERIGDVSVGSALKADASWEDVFHFLFQRLARKIPFIVLDNFPLLCGARKELPGILAECWKASPAKRNLVVVLCGSDIRFMENLVFSSDSPLKKAGAAGIRVGPLRFDDTKAFFPEYTGRDRAVAYSILGGSPAYLNRFNKNKTLEQNIKSEVLSQDCFLFEEPRRLLFEVLREPGLYFTMMRVLSSGISGLRIITEECGIGDIYMINKYLFRLRELSLVRKRLPFNEKDIERSRKSKYEIADHFMRFWFRFIYPNLSLLTQGEKDIVWRQEIRPQLDEYVRPVFRAICGQRIIRLNRYKKLPFQAIRIGPWWNRYDMIDVVAHDGRAAYLFCDCLWQDKKIGKDRLMELKRKARVFPERAKKYYAFFSKAGFSVEIKNLAQDDPDILLLDYY